MLRVELGTVGWSCAPGHLKTLAENFTRTGAAVTGGGAAVECAPVLLQHSSINVGGNDNKIVLCSTTLLCTRKKFAAVLWCHMSCQRLTLHMLDDVSCLTLHMLGDVSCLTLHMLGDVS